MQTKQQKRADAIARNKAWSKLTPEHQLAVLQTRRGNCKKQIARIKAKLAAAKGEKA